MFGQPQYRGGAAVLDGEEANFSYVQYIINVLEMNLLQDIVKPLDLKLKSLTNPMFNALGATSGLLDDIYNKYNQAKVSDGKLLAAIGLESMLAANNLIPSKILKVTVLDKVIFIFTTIFMRLLCNSLVEFMIGKGWINTISVAVIAFAGLYTLMFIALVIGVNTDLYRWRVVFNYINLHSNTGVMFTHIMMLWMLVLIILLIISNVNFPTPGNVNQTSTEEQKAYLMYRLELVNMFIWIFMIIIISVM
jgi:hypothetical protein